MIDKETVAEFRQLFRGRTDVYGHEDGMCVKEPLTDTVFAQHLAGENAIGVYPMVPYRGGFFVVWGCSDIDIDDWTQACAIRDALAAGGVTAHVERSRSKGYHVWVFASAPVSAQAMRRMLLCAHQVAEYPAREVNPKQETLAAGKYGNYVRLPYFNAADTTTIHRRVLDKDGSALGLDDFIMVAKSTLASPETINRLAAYWREPERSNTVIDLTITESLGDALKQLSPLGKVIWRDGPLPERDRSSTLTKLAYQCAQSGMSPSECKVVLIDADKRWGKYHLRPNGELEIDKLVIRVYA